MERHSSIHLYLDRDHSGIKATTEALSISEKYMDGVIIIKTITI